MGLMRAPIASQNSEVAGHKTSAMSWKTIKYSAISPAAASRGEERPPASAICSKISISWNVWVWPLNLLVVTSYPWWQSTCRHDEDLALWLVILLWFFQGDRSATSHSRSEHHVRSLIREGGYKKVQYGIITLILFNYRQKAWPVFSLAERWVMLVSWNYSSL